MKIFVVIVIAVLLNMCERPPAGKDIDRNAADRAPTDSSKMLHPMTSSANAASAPFELQFIDTMIAHHLGAIDMAGLADTRAQHDEVRSLAKAIVADQQKEIAQLRQWRAQWYGEAELAVNMEFPGMHEGMTGMDLQKLDKLKSNPFDIEFLKQMIVHHKGAVAMAQEVLDKDVHAEVKTLAEQVIKAQTAEIENMNRWLDEWSK